MKKANGTQRKKRTRAGTDTSRGRRIDILSVDWDSFFPDTLHYDWGHNEQSAMFFEMLWATRPGSVNMKTGKTAIEEIVPSGWQGFWDRLDTTPSTIVIAESHHDLFRVLETHGIRGARIWNLDAHHDLGYSNGAEPSCENWAAHALKRGMASEYNLVYPEWRRGSPENKPTMASLPRPRYGVGDLRFSPQMLFVCRSGCFSPTWADREWLEFVSGLKRFVSWQWKIALPYAMKERSPNRAEAEDLARQWAVMREQMAAMPAAVRQAQG